jgi:hypothetical protein
VISLPTS